MKNKQETSRIYRTLIVLGVLSIVIVACWLVFRSNSSNTPTATVCSADIKDTSNESSKLPTGWSWYEIKDAEVKYAYPNNWGGPTTLTNSGSSKYETSYTVMSSGANIIVSLSPSCSDFLTALADINNGKFDTQNDNSTTKAIGHDQSSYSSLSHWSSDAGNQYQLVDYEVVSVKSIKSAQVSYSLIAGSESCPDDRLALNNQIKCINQFIDDEIDNVINSLQKI